MTYLHALQYLGEENHLAASPSPRAGEVEETEICSAFAAEMGSAEPKFTCCLFTDDRAGLLCAAYCRSALLAAGISVGEIHSSRLNRLEQALYLNGTPISPAALREVCHTARAAEQKILRAKRALVRRTAVTASALAENSSPSPPDDLNLKAISPTDRCGVVFARLFANARCRVLFLIGSCTDFRLRALANRAPAMTVAVLRAGEHTPLPAFPVGTAEVICPTCSSRVFRQVTDACARAGSRLSVIATSKATQLSQTLFSQTFSYRSIPQCTLRCGSRISLRYALLAAETLFTLRRLGCPIDENAICRGFSTVHLPLFFSPISIHPLLIAHALHDADDADELQHTLQDFSPLLRGPIHLLCTDESAKELTGDAPAGCTPHTIRTLSDMTSVLSDASESAAYLLVGRESTVLPIVDAWQRSLRRL